MIVLDTVLAYLPQVAAWLIPLIAIQVVWQSRSVGFAVGATVALLTLNIQVMSETLITLGVTSPGGAFLFPAALVILAAMASRNGSDKGAIAVMHASVAAMLIILATHMRRLGYEFSSDPIAQANLILVDHELTRNAIMTIVAYYFSGTLILSGRRLVMFFTDSIVLRLCLPIATLLMVYTPLHLFAVALSRSADTGVPLMLQADNIISVVVVKLVIGISYALSIYPLVWKKVKSGNDPRLEM